jgi:hypothetical protein
MGMESQGMTRTGQTRGTRRETCPSVSFPSQILYGLNWARTQASAVRGQQVIAWAMARPKLSCFVFRQYRARFSALSLVCSDFPQSLQRSTGLAVSNTTRSLPPKEGVLRIFIALKNQSSRPSLNPRTLGPMTNTLTITPRRRMFVLIHLHLWKVISIRQDRLNDFCKH